MISNIKFTLIDSADCKRRILNNQVFSKRSLLNGHPTQKIDEISERIADIDDKITTTLCTGVCAGTSGCIVYKDILVLRLEDFEHTSKVIHYMFNRILNNRQIVYEIVYEQAESAQISIMYSGILRYFLNLSQSECILECSKMTDKPISEQIKIVYMSFFNKDYTINQHLYKDDMILPPISRPARHRPTVLSPSPMKLQPIANPLMLRNTVHGTVPCTVPSPPVSRSPSPALENPSFLKKIRSLCSFE